MIFPETPRRSREYATRRHIRLLPFLDKDDRAALVRLGAYAVLFILALLALLLAAAAAGLALRVFEALS